MAVGPAWHTMRSLPPAQGALSPVTFPSFCQVPVGPWVDLSLDYGGRAGSGEGMYSPSLCCPSRPAGSDAPGDRGRTGGVQAGIGSWGLVPDGAELPREREAGSEGPTQRLRINPLVAGGLL